MSWLFQPLLPTAAELLAGAPPPPPENEGLIKVWNGSSWVCKPVKVWNGTTWSVKPLKWYNTATSSWVTTICQAAAGPEYIGATTSNAGSGTTLAINVPTGTQSGDLLIVYTTSNATVGVDAPTGFGWTQVDGGGSAGTHKAFVTTHDGVQTSYTFTSVSTVAKGLIMLSYRGVSFGVCSASGSSTAPATAPTITVPADNSINVIFAGDNDDTLNFEITAASNPSLFTKLIGSGTNRSVAAFQRIAPVNAGTLAGPSVEDTTVNLALRALQLSLSPV